MVVALASGAGPFFSGAVDAAEAGRVALHQDLLRRVRRDPCEFLAAALSDGADGGKVCKGLRRDNGDLVVAMVASDGRKRVNLLKRDQRCPGNVVGADLRPSKEPRSVSYLELTLEGEDEKTLRFVGWLRMYE